MRSPVLEVIVALGSEQNATIKGQSTIYADLCPLLSFPTGQIKATAKLCYSSVLIICLLQLKCMRHDTYTYRPPTYYGLQISHAVDISHTADSILFTPVHNVQVRSEQSRALLLSHSLRMTIDVTHWCKSHTQY